MIFGIIALMLIYGIVDFFYHFRNSLAEKEMMKREIIMQRQLEHKRVKDEEELKRREKRDKFNELRRIRAIKPLLRPRMNMEHTGYNSLGIVTIRSINNDVITCGSKNGLVRLPVSNLGKNLKIAKDQSYYLGISYEEIDQSDIIRDDEMVKTTSDKLYLN